MWHFLRGVENMNTKEHGYRILFPKKASLIQRNEEIYKKRSKGETLQSIGDKYGISRERVRQIYVVRDRYERSRT